MKIGHNNENYSHLLHIITHTQSHTYINTQTKTHTHTKDKSDRCIHIHTQKHASKRKFI